MSTGSPPKAAWCSPAAWSAGTRPAFPAGVAAQIAATLRNTLAVLAEAGAGPEHIVRMTWYVTDVAAYVAARKEIGAAWRAVVGRHYPPMAVVGVVRLVEPDALVEIETTAVCRSDNPGARGRIV